MSARKRNEELRRLRMDAWVRYDAAKHVPPGGANARAHETDPSNEPH